MHQKADVTRLGTWLLHLNIAYIDPLTMTCHEDSVEKANQQRPFINSLKKKSPIFKEKAYLCRQYIIIMYEQ